jgi:hypothetical protein
MVVPQRELRCDTDVSEDFSLPEYVRRFPRVREV